jgi:hypothetical protein
MELIKIDLIIIIFLINIYINNQNVSKMVSETIWRSSY